MCLYNQQDFFFLLCGFFFLFNRVTDEVFNFLLVWYYCTLTIRESILISNGSRYCATCENYLKHEMSLKEKQAAKGDSVLLAGCLWSPTRNARGGLCPEDDTGVVGKSGPSCFAWVQNLKNLLISGSCSRARFPALTGQQG